MYDENCPSGMNAHKIRSFPGVDIGSDIDLVMTSLRLKLKKLPKVTSTRVKYNSGKSNEFEIQNEIFILSLFILKSFRYFHSSIHHFSRHCILVITMPCYVSVRPIPMKCFSFRHPYLVLF